MSQTITFYYKEQNTPQRIEILQNIESKRTGFPVSRSALIEKLISDAWKSEHGNGSKPKAASEEEK